MQPDQQVEIRRRAEEREQCRPLRHGAGEPTIPQPGAQDVPARAPGRPATSQAAAIPPNM